MNSDVRDILELEKPQTNKSGLGKGRKKFKRFIEPIKRPAGVNREVWGLIKKDDMDQPPLIPITDEPKNSMRLYKQPKAKLRSNVRKWKWTAFKNPARNDTTVFHHWRYENDENTQEYPFAKYNKKIQLTAYTDTEYNEYLEDELWSKEETDYLFEMCLQYDLRFYIIADRWNNEKYKTRKIDELKDRYYRVIGIMQKIKDDVSTTTQPQDMLNSTAVAIANILPQQVVKKEIFVFDLEHEQKRREQLEKLFNRTKEQIDEEEYLLEELKKIEIRKRERERKSQNVSQLLTAAVDLDVQVQSAPRQAPVNISAVKRIKARKSSLNEQSIPTTPPASLNLSASHMVASSGSLEMMNKDQKTMKKSLIFKAVVESAGIKFPDSKTAGVSLRSYRMKLPPSVGLKKTKAIEQLLEKLQIEHRPIATDVICDQFNELRSDIVLLYELNQANSNCEFELQTLKHRYEALNPGKSASDLLINLDNSAASSTSGTSQSQSLIETPQKRISDSFEIPVTPTTPLERRRKAALNQTNILKKLRGRGMSVSST